MDVVAGHGLLWVKVIARKAQALHLIWAGMLKLKSLVTRKPVFVYREADLRLCFLRYAKSRFSHDEAHIHGDRSLDDYIL